MAYKASGDRILFITTSLLTIFGLVMVYSASSIQASAQHEGMSSYYFLRQLIHAVTGFLFMIFLMNVDYHVWQKDRWLRALIAMSLAGLVFVLLQPPINGAHRWIRHGIVSFQPSEISKLVILIFLAAYLHKHESEINLLVRRLLPCLAAVLLFAALIAVEPDLGQALCVLLLASILLFIAGLSWKYIGSAALLSLPFLYFAVLCVPFRRERILAFLNPFHDPLGSNWQISQSLTAVGSGGAVGLGLGASRQKLFYLPEAQSDFIFAVIGEELGLIGTSLVCIAFLIFLYRGLKITLKAPDKFGFYLGLGITLMVGLQAFVNISMVLALMPPKGMALPFISQGGSSLLLNLMATGILLNLSHYSDGSWGLAVKSGGGR